MQVDRRTFLLGLGGAVLATAAGCAPGQGPTGPAERSTGPDATEGQTHGAPQTTPPLSSPTAAPPALPTTKGKVPVGRSITAIPVAGPYLAWTVDDGKDPDVVAAYADLAESTGNRVTFFLNGNERAWTLHADRLRPLVTSGQVQLGNHTWSHPDLRKLTTAQIQDQLRRNEDFILQTYGVSAAPYFRPPFGYIDAHVRAAAAAIGYTAPTLWYGSLSDSSVLTSDQIVSLGEQWFEPGRIVIAHANHPGVIDAMPRLVDLIEQRGLRTVTLRDVFAA